VQGAVQAEEVCSRIKSEGGKAVAIQTDVTLQADVRAMVKQAEASLGPIDILVNNAGHNPLHAIDSMSEKDWEEAIRIEIEGREREEEKPEREKAGIRRGRWHGAFYGGGAAIVALGVGLFLLASSQDRPRREEMPQETKSEGEPKESPPPKETENRREESVREPAPAAAREAAAPIETAKGPEPPPWQTEAKAPAAAGADKQSKVQAAPKKKEGIAPKPVAGADRPALPGAQRGKAEARQAEKPPAERGRATPPEEKEKPDGGSSSAPAQEPAAAGPEEVDPGKVIDWLIERRFDKR
jgi:hypothetical protein